MSEILSSQTEIPTYQHESMIGKVTLLEALATEEFVSSDSFGRCTMQGNVDFDD